LIGTTHLVCTAILRSEHFLKFISGEFTVPENLREESPPDRLTTVHRYNGTPPIRMAQEVMTAACADDLKAQGSKDLYQVGTGDGRKSTHQETATR
jgi:hypothetical protein